MIAVKRIAKLFHIRELDGLANGNAATIRPLAANDHPQHCRFARAVWADDTYNAARRDSDVKLIDQYPVVEAPNYASLNLTGLLLSVAMAIGDLAGPKAVAKSTAEEFLSTPASWK